MILAVYILPVLMYSKRQQGCAFCSIYKCIAILFHHPVNVCMLGTFQSKLWGSNHSKSQSGPCPLEEQCAQELVMNFLINQGIIFLRMGS